MENLKQPGIAIEEIRLIRAQVEVKNLEGDKRYSLRLLNIARVESPDGKALHCVFAFDVMHGIENPIFVFTCDFIARYTRRGEDSMAWNEFVTPIALAHVIPYLREFVSNITNRLPVPVLMLDPVNTAAMVAEYELRRAEAEKARPAQPPTAPVISTAQG
jgi:hypothetical protein